MKIKEKIENWIKETLKIEDVTLMHPKEMKNGDFSLIVSKNAKEYAEKLNQNKLPEIDKIQLVEPRFINIFLSEDFFADSLGEINKLGGEFGESKFLDGQKIIIEHTQPNPFKEFHIGHLMNNAIGESIYRILKANGAEVKACSYHGDVGLHVAKAILGIKESPDRRFPLDTDNLATKVVFMGMAYQLGSSLYDSGDGFRQKTEDINRKIYDKTDNEINKLYEWGRDVSLKYFESIYEELDSHFDEHFYESESGEAGKKLVEENIGIGKIFEKSEGAVIFRGENFEPKTHTRVFLNKDDLPTYEAKEVGLAKLKKEKFGNYNKSITVTADEQDSFFSVVEVAIGEIFPQLKGKLLHLSHGILKLATGKMSSRSGNVIASGAVLADIRYRVEQILKDEEYSDEDKNNISKTVAIGAIKYSILRQAVGGDIIFNFDKSISFEGDSGPYLQYTHTRTKSVLKKAKGQNLKIEIKTPGNWKTVEVERMLYRFSEVIELAGKEYSPHHLVTYLTEIAGAFNNFYAKEKIIDQNDPVSPYKLAITQAVSRVLQNGLYLLGIKTLDRM